jgi:hypothetical protein
MKLFFYEDWKGIIKAEISETCLEAWMMWISIPTSGKLGEEWVWWHISFWIANYQILIKLANLMAENLMKLKDSFPCFPSRGINTCRWLVIALKGIHKLILSKWNNYDNNGSVFVSICSVHSQLQLYKAEECLISVTLKFVSESLL